MSDGIQAERTAALDERLRPKSATDTVASDASVSKLAASQILALAVEGGGSTEEVITRATAYKKWIQENDND